MRFAFVDAEKACFPVAAICRVLEVTRQGYYMYLKQRTGQRVKREVELQEQIRRVYAASEQRYGSPRVLRELRRQGINVGKARIERSMRGMGLVARHKRHFRVTTKADPRHAVERNLLDRRFEAARPNQRWVTDITYVWTAEGWCYVAIILDLFSRSVVGWAVDASLSTALPLAALDMAVRRRRPQPGLMHHSDRGSQYTSTQYREALASIGVEVSMSRKGNCWDNAVAESFFSTAKTELISRSLWSSRLQLRTALFEYIEVFYNRKRLHSSLGYRTPAEVENEFVTDEAA